MGEGYSIEKMKTQTELVIEVVAKTLANRKNELDKEKEVITAIIAQVSKLPANT